MGALLLPLAVIALLIVLYLVFDRRRYHGRISSRQRPTGEVFRDPSTGQLTRVYEDPETGVRSYRPEINKTD
ncbi:MAG TPA: hypothetical protein VFP94_03260 [Terriglobales bacterium]|nr:hypothetical protein [Terriglobales bacterium]